MPYHTREGMYAAYDALQAEFPNLVSSEIVGQSVEGRDLKIWLIGNPDGGRVMFSGTTHGYERTPTEALFVFVDWVLRSSDADAVRIRDRNLIISMPFLDIDRSPDLSGLNANFVNLYRNCDFHWGVPGQIGNGRLVKYNCFKCTTGPAKNSNECKLMSGNWITVGDDPFHATGCGVCNTYGDQYASAEKCAGAGFTWLIQTWSQYWGPSCESEPETRALRDVWLKYLPKNYIDLHCGSMYPTCWFSWEASPADKQKMIDIGVRYTARARAAGVSPYPWEENTGSSGCPVSAVYKVTGGKTFGYVVESSPHSSWTTMISSVYPRLKQLFISLCAESEYPILTTVSSQGGSVLPKPGNYFCDLNSTTRVSATPMSDQYELMHWEIDGIRASAGLEALRRIQSLETQFETLRDFPIEPPDEEPPAPPQSEYMDVYMNASHSIKPVFRVKPYVQAECFSMDGTKEFNIFLNDVKLYQSVGNAARKNIWFTVVQNLPLPVVPQDGDPNVVTLSNETVSILKVRNVRVVLNNALVVNDAPEFQLRASQKSYQIVYP